jgi:phosphotransferase system HPr (HPr) family protein
MVAASVVVRKEVGLHARPASLFVLVAKRFGIKISICNLTTGGSAVDAKSILMVLALGVVRDPEIRIQAEGPDEAPAIATLVDLVQSDFKTLEEGS